MEKQLVLEKFRESLAADYWFQIAQSVDVGISIDGVLHIDTTGTSAWVEFRLRNFHNGDAVFGGGLPTYTRTFFNRVVTDTCDNDRLDKFRQSLEKTHRIPLATDYTTGSLLEALVCILPNANYSVEFVISNKVRTTLLDCNFAAQTRRMVDHLWVG